MKEEDHQLELKEGYEKDEEYDFFQKKTLLLLSKTLALDLYQSYMIHHKDLTGKYHPPLLKRKDPILLLRYLPVAR